MEKVRWDVGRGCGVRGRCKNMLCGGVSSICSLFQGHSPGGATVFSDLLCPLYCCGFMVRDEVVMGG